MEQTPTSSRYRTDGQLLEEKTFDGNKTSSSSSVLPHLNNCPGCGLDLKPFYVENNKESTSENGCDDVNKENKSLNRESTSPNGQSPSKINPPIRRTNKWIHPIYTWGTNERIDPPEIKRIIKSYYMIAKDKAKPYICLVDHDCHVSYAFSSSIEKHLFSRFFVVPCPNCQKTFTLYRNMTKHLENCKISKCEESIKPCEHPLPTKEGIEQKKNKILCSNRDPSNIGYTDGQDEDSNSKLNPKVLFRRLSDSMIESGKSANQLDQIQSSSKSEDCIARKQRFRRVKDASSCDKASDSSSQEDGELRLMIDEEYSDECDSEIDQANEIIDQVPNQSKTSTEPTLYKDLSRFNPINDHGSLHQTTNELYRNLITNNQDVPAHQNEGEIEAETTSRKKPNESEIQVSNQLRSCGTSKDKGETLKTIGKIVYPTVLRTGYNQFRFAENNLDHFKCSIKGYFCLFCDFYCGPNEYHSMKFHLNGRRGKAQRPICIERRKLKPADSETGIYEQLEPILHWC